MKRQILGLLLGAAVMMAMPAAAEEANTAPAETAAAAEEASQPAQTEAAAPAAEAGETVTTADGVLSIQLPSSGWQQMADPNYWFVATNGTDVITIDHFSNGESLPSVEVAGNIYGAVYQAFVSTRNEVFVVKGSVMDQASMESIMKAIGTVKVLQYDTKTAVQKEEAAQTGEFAVRALSGIYLVNTDELNVRSGYSSDASVLGVLYKDEEVQVTGAVTQGGKDYGWYQILYNGATAYVSAGFLTAKDGTAASQAGVETAAAKATTGIDGSGNVVENPAEKGLAYCEYCGKWYEEGNVFRNHVCPARDAAVAQQSGETTTWDPAAQGLVQCEYCGQWFEEGNVFRNHVCPARDAALSGGVSDGQEGSTTVADPAAAGLVYCEYCGQWYEEGEVFRNHVCPARDAAYSEGVSDGQEEGSTTVADPASQGLVYCEYCGQWYEEGEIFRNHVCPARDAALSGGVSDGQEEGSTTIADPASQGLVYCEYCGQWYEEGEIFRNHVCPARDAAYAEGL